MFNNSIRQIATDLSKKKYSCVELLQTFLARIKTYDPILNTFITLTSDFALQSAKHADYLRAKGNCPPLTGIPIAHKDNYYTKGIKTTCGSKMLANHVALFDATVVERLEQAGMISLGKTNMDEFAMGSSNETSFFGPVKNPWDITCVPGGSSGGSAAAVAARLIPAATATDTGGSTRQPAALCGVTGFKPTFGRVSRYGMIAFTSSIDHASIIAKSAEDIALLLEIIAGKDICDPSSSNIAISKYSDGLNAPLHGIKIGLPKEYFATNLPPEVATLLENAMRELEALGASLHIISLPNTDLAEPAYCVLASAECTFNLAHYDGRGQNYHCDNQKNLEDLNIRSRNEDFGSEVKRRIISGTFMLAPENRQYYFLQAEKVRHLLCSDFKQAFHDVDLILAPTSADTAFKIGMKTHDPIKMYLADRYTVGASLAGVPAISVPIGFSQNLPIGMQLIGNYFSEAKILNAAHRYQMVTDWHRLVPSL